MFIGETNGSSCKKEPGQALDPATFKHEGHALCKCHAEGYPTKPSEVVKDIQKQPGLRHTVPGV